VRQFQKSPLTVAGIPESPQERKYALRGRPGTLPEKREFATEELLLNLSARDLIQLLCVEWWRITE
jgi:hypothetical protein